MMVEGFSLDRLLHWRRGREHRVETRRRVLIEPPTERGEGEGLVGKGEEGEGEEWGSEGEGVRWGVGRGRRDTR